MKKYFDSLKFVHMINGENSRKREYLQENRRIC